MNNTQIDYRAEVQKVYPDAFIDFNDELNAGNVYIGYFETPFGRMPKRICSLLSSSDNERAYEIAYNRLKSEGKI